MNPRRLQARDAARSTLKQMPQGTGALGVGLIGSFLWHAKERMT